jgi:hypothetical protein
MTYGDTMSEEKGKTKGLRHEIYGAAKPAEKTNVIDFGDAVDMAEASEGTERIQVRLSRENYDWLKAEAKRTASPMSALASIAVSDWIEERRAKRRLSTEAIVKALEEHGHFVNKSKRLDISFKK